MQRTILRLLVLGVVAILTYYFNLAETTPTTSSSSPPPAEASESVRTAEEGAPPHAYQDSATRIKDAYQRGLSGFMVESKGRVERLLADDNEGDRHQRFILELSNGHTLLVAHNIDIAKRVPARAGESITLYGQYEHNDRGGVLHWTHRALGRNHESGWIEHNGVRYD